MPSSASESAAVSASWTVIPAATIATSSSSRRAEDAAAADRRTPRRARRAPASPAQRAQVRDARRCRPSPRRAAPSGSRRTGGARSLPWIARKRGDVLERHLRRAVLADRHAGVRAAERERRAADRRHADEVVGAREEGGERRGERPPADGLEPDRGRDHLLLGDVHLEVAIRVRLREDLRVRRVRDLAVERRRRPGARSRAPRARRRRPCASRPPRRARSAGARAVAAAGARGAVAVGLRDLDRGRRARRRARRSPPSGSSSGLPWKPFSFSTAVTPLPFIVRATMTVGRARRSPPPRR